MALPAFECRSLPSDAWLLLATRGLRMFAYGLLSVVLVLYLTEVGLNETSIGLLLTAALLGDVVVSLWMTTSADRVGRRRVLVLGSLLMALVGAVFASTDRLIWLVAAAAVGVLSPSDKEVGPFLSIEQAALTQVIGERDPTATFAWYHLIGSMTAALGALAGGFAAEHRIQIGLSGADVYRPVVVAYGIIGALLAVAFTCVSPVVEPRHAPVVPQRRSRLGLHTSRGVILQLSGLFALDAFGGGFIVQSLMAYWFHVRFQVDPGFLGSLFFTANLLAALSALGAARLAKRFGLVNTMVFTHLPSNILLVLVPLMPTLPLAVAVLLRFTISQMDVPTRQSYTMSVVHPDERSAAAGLTTVARSIGAAASPILAGWFLAQPALMGAPFFIAGGVKIVYDLLLYRAFVSRSTPTSP